MSASFALIVASSVTFIVFSKVPLNSMTGSPDALFLTSMVPKEPDFESITAYVPMIVVSITVSPLLSILTVLVPYDLFTERHFALTPLR
jgi:hypothetical protein